MAVRYMPDGTMAQIGPVCPFATSGEKLLQCGFHRDTRELVRTRYAQAERRNRESMLVYPDDDDDYWSRTADIGEMPSGMPRNTK